ncbi:MAG: hypothetical protein H9533_13660 [Rhodobacteraceae bacterium]|nr:hypothetical protein [Paracoccaceae bacterium]
MTRGYPLPGSLDVLFVTYGGGHVQMVLPVAQRLQKLGARVCIFALTTAIHLVRESGLPFFTYADLPQFQDPATRDCGKRLAADLSLSGILPAIETEAYLGVNYRDLEQTFGVETAADLWIKGGRQNFQPLNTMRSLLSDVKPALVVGTNSPRSEKAVIEAASELGIDAVAMVDMFALQEIKWLSRKDFGCHLFVLDESVRQRMIQMGRRADQVTVTGNPAFDSLNNPKVITAGRKLRADQGWGHSNRVVILSASTPEPELHPFTGEPANPALPRMVEDALREIVAKDPRIDLVIRRHPSEDQAVIISDRVHASSRSDDVNAVIHAVDLVVVTCSTVGLQAYLAGVPVISVEGSVFTKDAPYGDYGMATPVPDPTELQAAISEILLHLRPKSGCGSESTKESATDSIATAIMNGLKRGWHVVQT